MARKTLVGILVFVCSLTLLAGCGESGKPVNAVKSVVKVAADDRYSLVQAPNVREIAARKLLAAMEAGDTKTLLAMSDPEEREYLKLTEANLDRLMKLYIKERKSMRSLGIADCRPGGRDGTMCLETLRSEKADYTIEGYVYERKVGIRALVSQALIRGLQSLRGLDSSLMNTDTATLQSRTDFYRWLKGQLQPAGIPGLVFLGFQDGKVRFVTWDFLIQRSEERLKEPNIPMHP